MIKEMLLVVDAPHFVAGAIWEKIDDSEWKCIKAAPIIKWMVGKSPEYIKKYIEKNKYKVTWVNMGKVFVDKGNPLLYTEPT